jgi:hypothetical protein
MKAPLLYQVSVTPELYTDQLSAATRQSKVGQAGCFVMQKDSFLDRFFRPDSSFAFAQDIAMRNDFFLIAQRNGDASKRAFSQGGDSSRPQ